MSSVTTAASATGANAVCFMEILDPFVSLYQPSEASSSSSSYGAGHQPRLIIIASWTGARSVHIAKYIIKYQALYPASQILLLRSTMNHIIRPSLIGPSIKCAASVVRSTFPTVTSSASPPLLIHMFSNGGSSSIANLYEQYRIMAGPDDEKQLPPHVTIFDSCPGVYSITHAVAFVSVSLSSVQQLIAAPILYAWAVVWSAFMALGLLPDSLGDWGKAHNNDPGNKAEIRRVYIYSPSDALIDYRAVETHAADAKTKGFSPKLEKYEGSAHVAHLRKDEKRYWEIVRRSMEGSVAPA
ncbi:hypothetical protein JX265_003269 [Neoarthrinium moseri]|uniref:Indole-diterpene biosynthesis protein PaxU n=1 Tax=Neoarthrinium moseri TaxID=1658444 RepID=A0A9P9WTJ3_9PEZI|nr:hypothetical protein JX266_002324 [Neoarthrinium moseri]KAI1879092.1 hypothetical protein JX265_003269 [Neoarthrinium moseri]